MEHIYANLEEGLLFLNQSWEKLDDEAVSNIFHEIYKLPTLQEDIDHDDSGASGVTRLVLKGRLPESLQLRLLNYLIRFQPSIMSLSIVEATAPFWLLPTLLRLLPKLRTIELRDPADANNYEQEKASSWPAVREALMRHKNLRTIRLAWTETREQKSAHDQIMTAEDLSPASTTFFAEWVNVIMGLQNLAEFTQQGNHPAQLWTRKQVAELLKHPGLQKLRLSTTLVGEWPNFLDQFLSQYPTRWTPLIVWIPHLLVNDISRLEKIKPVRYPGQKKTAVKSTKLTCLFPLSIALCVRTARYQPVHPTKAQQ